MMYIQIQVPISYILVKLLIPLHYAPMRYSVSIDQNFDSIQNFITKSRPPFINNKRKTHLSPRKENNMKIQAKNRNKTKLKTNKKLRSDGRSHGKDN